MMILYTNVVNIHKIMPHIVGSKKLSIVHFRLLVSFFIVSIVVLHGKCNNVKIITLIAVKIVHPFWIKI